MVILAISGSPSLCQGGSCWQSCASKKPISTLSSSSFLLLIPPLPLIQRGIYTPWGQGWLIYGVEERDCHLTSNPSTHVDQACSTNLPSSSISEWPQARSNWRIRTICSPCDGICEQPNMNIHEYTWTRIDVIINHKTWWYFWTLEDLETTTIAGQGHQLVAT